MNMKIRPNHLEPMGFEEFSRLIDLIPASRSPMKVEPLLGAFTTRATVGREGRVIDLSSETQIRTNRLRLVNGY
ncbi:hypothetical protein [Photobacterium galatheae]|uniref:Uncharacterized protein n=1 Tax=Photobacterium galatheae TaxID=1654360 RepID=A0A066RZW2_9GAMM|nr:hypothetical protein [Photobacterium galatheae]KDM93192.1 hypothetical protein EA58_03100 [Photobacterium galatheae]MCM0148279.1 hypothetical protein [Photobacterium galatheae]